MKPKTGFASMDPQRQRQIASMGGKAVHPSKRSFSTNRTLAIEAGRKGGQSVPSHKRSFATRPQLAAEAGRLGAKAVRDNSEEGRIHEDRTQQEV